MSAVLTTEIKAYAWLIKLCAIGVCAALLFFGGCHVQKQHDKAEWALVIGQRNDAYASLTASAAALKAVNDQAKATIAQAKASEQAANKAADLANSAKLAAQKESDSFKARVAKASKTPACQSILTTHVGAVCALSSR